MEKIVTELKKIVEFKNTTDIGDIVLIAAKEPQVLLYGYVVNIEQDTTRKDEWWHLHLTMLSVPLQRMTWTLRTSQMTGQEIFTMGGEERFIQAVDVRHISEPQTIPESLKKSGGKGLRRVK